MSDKSEFENYKPVDWSKPNTSVIKDYDKVPALDFISKSSGYGEFTSAITNTLVGMNYRGIGNATLNNTEQFGLTFFTRPYMNMSRDNLITARILTPLLTQNQNSYGAYIRHMLDPLLAHNANFKSDVFDNRMAFIPLLTNNLISLSGWPDIVTDTYKSAPGVYKEEYSMVDGHYRIFNTFDLTANFRNIKGDPITLLFTAWTQYASRVYLGEFDPYDDALLNHEIDYMTRIYRLTLDPAREYVQKIAACGASFPWTNPLGAHFNFSEEQPFSREADQISIQFRCIGADYLDPITIKEFNTTVGIFNGSMADPLRRQRYYYKLPLNERMYFNYKGFPRIDPDTHEFQIWVEKSVYNAELGF